MRSSRSSLSSSKPSSPRREGISYPFAQRAAAASATASAIQRWRSAEASAASSSRVTITPASRSTAGARLARKTTSPSCDRCRGSDPISGLHQGQRPCGDLLASRSGGSFWVPERASSANALAPTRPQSAGPRCIVHHARRERLFWRGDRGPLLQRGTAASVNGRDAAPRPTRFLPPRTGLGRIA